MKFFFMMFAEEESITSEELMVSYNHIASVHLFYKIRVFILSYRFYTIADQTFFTFHKYMIANEDTVRQPERVGSGASKT